SKLAPCAAHTSWPSRLSRNFPGAQSRRRPACGQTLSQARTAAPARCTTSDSVSPSSTASTATRPPSGIASRLTKGGAFNELITTSTGFRPILPATPPFWHGSSHAIPLLPLPHHPAALPVRGPAQAAL